MIIFINIELAKVPGYHSLTDGCKRPYEIGLWTDGGDDGSQTNTAEPARAEQVGYDFENPVNGSYSDISKTQVYEAQNVFAG